MEIADVSDGSSVSGLFDEEDSDGLFFRLMFFERLDHQLISDHS
jgi:hypothetical protein